MADGKQHTDETDEESRQRRQQALRSLAHDDTSTTAETGLTSIPTIASPMPALRRRRWWIATLVVALCVVVLASVGYFAFLRPTLTSTTPITKKPISELATQDDLACVQDMAVSPDGASIAILGYHQNCADDQPNDYRYLPGQVNIYDVSSGQLTATVHPDDSIASKLHLQAPPSVHPDQPGSDISHTVINYLHMFWSVDSTQLALTFYIQTYASATSADNTPTSYTDGVLLTDIKAAHPRVLANTRNPQDNYSCAWSVTTGACIHMDPGNSWQPALGYMWDATGALVPQGQPLTTTAPAPPAPAFGPIGSPVGGSSFTIWQPGQIAFVTDPSSSNPSAPVPGLYRFFSDFPVWSPNGSQLHLDMSVNDVIVADGHSLPDAASPVMRQIGQNVPVLPMRDKGLAAALAAQATPQFIIENGSGAAVSLAWRPDGRMLAVDIPSTVVPGKVAPSQAGVALYDCATGKLLTTLYQPSSPYGKNDQTFMNWAGDGLHLILLDASTGYFTIWGPDQLPKV